MEDHDETDDTTLDPRIQIELEKLNTATDEINRLEVELDEANTTFRILQNECTRRLSVMKAKLGSCIQKARPYYDALEVAKEAQLECQKVAIQFQRANEIHQAAKETVALAEQRFLSKQHEWQFDNAWQEMLNHATIKVTDAETQKAECGREHQKKAMIFHEAEQKVQQLEQKLRRYINKSRPFFEERDLCIGQLRAQKDRISTLQKQVTSMKESYAASLKELESISEEIHRKRKTNASTLSLDQPESEADLPKGPREPGVGAELTPVFKEEPAMFHRKITPAETSEEVPKDNGSKTATEANCDIFYFEPKKSPGRAGHTSLPLLDNLALVRKSEDGPEVPISCPSSGFAHWTEEFKAELDKFDMASLGSMSVATGSSAVSELGEGEEIEDMSDFQASFGMLSLQNPGVLKCKSMPASPTKACSSGTFDTGCCTPPPSPAHTITSSKMVFSSDAPRVIPEERSDYPVLTERKLDENCSL